jgi:hypothetical protein
MNNWCICWFFTHILMKCTVQKPKSPVKTSSGSVARRDLIPALKGYVLISVDTMSYSSYFFNTSDVLVLKITVRKEYIYNIFYLQLGFHPVAVDNIYTHITLFIKSMNLEILTHTLTRARAQTHIHTCIHTHTTLSTLT